MSMQQLRGQRRLSHAYILSAPSREEGLDMARALAADVLCSRGEGRACGLCRDCRKVSQGIHPDITLVSRPLDDKGREKKNIVVDQIRYLVADSQVLPNEAERKVYIIDQAERMNEEAQNAALKLLEEPPARLTIILSTTNAHSLLPTVRSRCVEVHSEKGGTEQSAESARLAEEYLGILDSGDSWKLCTFCMKNEGMDNQGTLEFLLALEKAAVDRLCGRTATGRLKSSRLLSLCALIERCRSYLRVNTGVKHIFGLLAVFSAGEEQEGK